METIANELLFYALSTGCRRSQAGRRQFFEWQSYGVYPKRPSKYFLRLCAGKQVFDFLRTEYRRLYFGGEWWGMEILKRDWGDKDWVIPHLMPWHQEYICWLKEESWRTQKDAS